MDSVTPWSALAGGLLIGLASSLMLLMNGRITGISGIVGSLLSPVPGDISWRLWFLGGLLAGGLLLLVGDPGTFGATQRPMAAVAVAGLLVGFGTRLGSGCTSGHGVCGNSRFSIRSILATITFIATGAISVAAWNWLGGGQ